MKRISLVIAVLALLSGLSSCRKPDTSSWSSYHKQPITFSNAVSDNQKTLVDGGSSLYYEWESDDKIRVYTTTEDDDFSNGHYCGDLKLTKGAGTKVATFHNPGVYIPAGHKKIRFIYVGKGISVNGGGTDEVDFSNQDGGISSVSDKLIAIYDTGINETGVYEEGELRMQFSVIEFSFSDFSGDVYVKGMKSNGLKVKNTGKITYNTAKANTKFVLLSDDFYAVFMPQGSTTYRFANADGYADRTFTVGINSFYNQGDSEGNPIEIAPEPTKPADPPAVTTYFGCGNGLGIPNYVGIFNYGGVVTSTATQTCEFGIVYSTTIIKPEIGVTGCVNEAAAKDVSLSSSMSFSIDVAPLNIDDHDKVYARAYAIGENLVPVYGVTKTIESAEGIAKSHPDSWKNGENPHPFTVAFGKTVHFSQGNLQWTAAGTHAAYDGDRPGTWRFAEHQFDIIGDENEYIDKAYTGWIDLFGWATSGYYPSTPEDRRQPYRWDRENETYGNGEFDLDHNLDWGRYNDISNDGGYGVSAWRTLSKDEWCYMIKPLYFYDGEWKPYTGESRANAENLRGFATIGGCTHGVVVLPDGWTGVGIDCSFTDWTDNEFTHPEWREMEENGAVFLPAAGARDEKEPSGVNFWGCYWSGTHYKTVSAIYFDFSTIKNPELGDFKAYVGYYERFRGRSVRVVRDVTSK